MQRFKLLFIVFSLCLQACSAMKPADFTPADPEAMNEWQVEGKLKLNNSFAYEKTYFTWTQLGDKFTLALNTEDPVGKPEVTLSGGDDAKLTITPKNRTGKIEDNVKVSLPFNYLKYWLRGLPATESAQVSGQSVRELDSLEEGGWHVEFLHYMQAGPYLLPDQLKITKGSDEVVLDITRAETGFLTHCCSQELADESSDTEAPAADSNNNSVNATPTSGANPVVAVSAATIAAASAQAATENPAPEKHHDAVAELVPANGMAPLPKWINDKDFCEQLKKIHNGKIPDPRIGLYGPDSMMWKLSRNLMPAAWGSGRTLLLQTAHPWITAGIDEHSIVREDPMQRFRRTFSNIATMMYGSMPQVMASANLVHKTHKQITGTIPYEAGAFKKGSTYGANEVNAMIWVHATLWETVVKEYEQFEGPLTHEEKDRFYEETKLFAMLFGIPKESLPANWDEFMAYNEAMWNSAQLTVTPNARKLADDLFTPRSIFLAVPLWAQKTITNAELPPRIREGYGMEYTGWEKFKYNIFMAGAKVTTWILPSTMEEQYVSKQAYARIHGEKTSYIQRKVLKTTLGKEYLVN
ncbi:MAG TPA: lipoprotein insertase outer membrane protein LolB [Pseudomonadales bacterium]|nr:lipoprotein insertase outer membrane protein LolB [Pseudomonadales bacterium]